MADVEQAAMGTHEGWPREKYRLVNRHEIRQSSCRDSAT
jgi:hypothetical protein